MRKLFTGTILVSVLGALVIGAVLAWLGSIDGSGSATAGSVSIAFNNYTSSSNLVIPNDTDIEVARTGFTNNGAIKVKPDASNPGSATVTATSAGSNCFPTNFSTPRPNTVGTSSAYVNPTASSGDDAFRVYVNMKSGAANGCQGVAISYNVTINVKT